MPGRRDRFVRFNPGPIARYHFESFRAPGAKRLSWADRVMLLVVPVVAGVATGTAVLAGMRLVNGVSQVLAATALLVGVMLSAFVFLTNLRIKVSESATYAFRANLHRLIAGAAVSCLYIAGVALITAGLLALVATVAALRAPAARPFTAGVLAMLLVHLFINLMSVARRLFATYMDIFAADFSPERPPREPAAPSMTKQSRPRPD